MESVHVCAFTVAAFYRHDAPEEGSQGALNDPPQRPEASSDEHSCFWSLPPAHSLHASPSFEPRDGSGGNLVCSG